jgi:hypothetical protein
MSNFTAVQMQSIPSGLIALSGAILFLLWVPEYIQYNSLPNENESDDHDSG